MQQNPIKHMSVDRVYCYGVLHHLEDPLAVLKNATDILKPGGSLSHGYMDLGRVNLLINNALREDYEYVDEATYFSRIIANY